MSGSPAPSAPHIPEGHARVAHGKIAVLLINLGTPDATGYWSMRRYLSEFLSDRRVIEINPVKWQLILQGLVLMRRPQRSGEAYDKIWNRERDESPLRTITREQAGLLSKQLAKLSGKIVVDWAMRYGAPAIADKLKALQAQGCERILLCPLYPQYAAATTATANDKAFDALKTMRWQPAVRTLPPYFDHPAYIDALANSLKSHLKSLKWQPDKVIASFHGLPQDYFDKGDPYPCQCRKTARLLREKLGWGDDKLLVTFQSRFGRAEWIKPYTDETLLTLARDGVKRVVVITPGFSADCVETLEEIAIQAREDFVAAGGAELSVVACLNASKPGMAMLETLVRQELQGWV